MDKKLFTVDEIDFIRTAILRSAGKSIEEREALANKVKDVLNGRYSNK